MRGGPPPVQGPLEGHLAEGEGLAIYLQLDEPMLREVARMAGGENDHAATVEAPRSVYQKLGTRLQTQTRETELRGCWHCLRRS